MTDARLDALAGNDATAQARMAALVRSWICPCLANKTCRWPGCAKIGDGIGHYP